jgi:hypothetical protein
MVKLTFDLCEAAIAVPILAYVVLSAIHPVYDFATVPLQICMDFGQN